MNLIGALLLLLLIPVVLLAHRRMALLAIMAGVLFLTQSQAITVLGLNLFAVRFLELAGFLRVVARREFSFSALNRIDHALLLLYSFMTAVYLMRASDGQGYVIGWAVDAFLCYFTFRGLVRDIEEFRCFLKAFIVLLVPYAALVLVESLAHYNVFNFFGGDRVAWIRSGRFRCLGSFRNPDLLGTLGSSFLPLYIGLSWVPAQRGRALLGAALCLLFVWASNSGGPLGATAVGLVGWSLWLLRTKMRTFRWALVGVIVALALAMKAPVWYLFANVSRVTGGDGWHRSYLLDVSFQHLRQWWLAGMSIKDTSDWFPYQLAATGGADITNQFIGFGLTAGLGAVVLFLLLLTRAFGGLGKSMAALRSALQHPSSGEFLLWGLGVMLAVHIANWFGISYFDQFYVIWFMQLAAISSISASFQESMLHLRQSAQSVPSLDVLGAETELDHG